MKWVAVAFYAVCDAVLAAVFAFFVDSNNPGGPFLGALAFLWLAPMALGILGLGKFWLWYHLGMKRILVRGIKADFHKNKFPPSAAYFDHEIYLRDIMAEDGVPEAVKMRAAYLLGELAAAKSERPLTSGFAVSLAYGQAIEEYKP